LAKRNIITVKYEPEPDFNLCTEGEGNSGERPLPICTIACAEPGRVGNCICDPSGGSSNNNNEEDDDDKDDSTKMTRSTFKSSSWET